MQLIKLITIGMIVILLSACTSTKELKIINSPTERTQLDLSNPPAVLLNDFEWIIVTVDNIDQVLKKLEQSNTDVVLFALTDEGYESLAMNQQKIRNYILQLQDILNAYREYYESNDQTRSPDGN